MEKEQIEKLPDEILLKFLLSEHKYYFENERNDYYDNLYVTVLNRMKK